MARLLLSFFIVFLVSFRHAQSITREEYLAQREQFLTGETSRILGGSLTLNSNEQAVNTMLMDMKTREYDQAFNAFNLDFVPAVHYFKSKETMSQSEVYQFIRSMPKGGVLHIHDTALAALDFIIDNASYRPDLWVCSPTEDPVYFRYAPSAPTNLPNCQWQLVSERRAQEGEEQFNLWMRSKLSLYTPNPEDVYPDINSVWKAFGNTFVVSEGIITYEPVFRDYFYQGLLDFYTDNVQYIEIRTTLPPVYKLDGTVLSPVEITQLYKEIFDQFKVDHPDFTGAKIIYAPSRKVSNTVVSDYIALASQLKAQFPDHMVGFDMVGQEDMGYPLKTFVDELLAGKADPNLHYFFHASETNWHGTDTDENLIDAILLNTTRIGHGFGITKHPAVMEMARYKGVAVEVNPISNQVLSLVSDLRNHPAVSLFVDGFPLVISSDDPASWEAVALSSDYYMAFMGMAGKRADLRTLKQLAINSLIFSAMTTDEKNSAVAEWQRRWNAFISTQYDNYKTKHNLV